MSNDPITGLNNGPIMSGERHIKHYCTHSDRHSHKKVALLKTLLQHNTNHPPVFYTSRPVSACLSFYLTGLKVNRVHFGVIGVSGSIGLIQQPPLVFQLQKEYNFEQHFSVWPNHCCLYF